MSAIRAWLSVLLLVLIGLVSAELGARIDDRLFVGTPIADHPAFEDLFFSLDDGIRRGVPHARFKKAQLNALGLLGPELPLERTRGCTRWLILGASETFGEPSVVGGDYPSKLRERLAPHGCFEVANAASAGIDLRISSAQFAAYLWRLQPDAVLLYPPTHFYLSDVSNPSAPSAASLAAPPGTPPPPRPAASGPLLARVVGASRLLERLRDTAEVPAPIQRWRTQRWIDAALAEHPADWPYRSVPSDRLDLLEADLVAFVELVRAKGAEPVLMAHAVRVAREPRPSDQPDLFGMRVFTPRAEPEVLAAFEYAAAERTRAVARRLGVRCVDVAGLLSGRREFFIDLVHFTPDGASRVAAEIARTMGVVTEADDALQ